MIVTHDDLWLCTDCMVTAVNDDYSAFLSDESVEATKAGLERLGGPIVADFDSDTGDGYEEFTWRHCDCCRSRLGGSRHRFAILGEAT